METLDLTSSRFWSTSESLVFANPRDPIALSEAEIMQPWIGTQAELIAHLLFRTSGSTGKGKWVALSKSALLASARAVNEFLNVTSADRWLLTLPAFHVGGMGIAARAYLARCKMVNDNKKWDAARCHQLCVTENITLTSLVPAQLLDLVRLKLPAPESLRALLVGGGRLEDSVYQKAIDLGWPVHETYGMTETSSQVATANAAERRLRVLPHWEVSVNDDGRLQLRGEAALTCYVGCERGACFMEDPKQDGWLVTNDRGNVSCGELTVYGRADRCVKILGELVDLSEVERTIQLVSKEAGLPYQELVVMAVQPPEAGEYRDQRRGTLLILCCEKNEGMSGMLGKYNAACHALQRIKGIALLEAIPRTPIGKIDYPLLSQLLQSEK